MTAIAVTVAPPWWTRLWVFRVMCVALVFGGFYFVHIPLIAHFITYWTGQDLETGGHYGAWSGFWGAIQPSLIATGVIVYWRTTCHQHNCWLPGKHPTTDGSMKLCRYHHPDIKGRKLTDEVVAELHALGHWRMHNAPEGVRS